jgi:uncharacterized protein
MLRIANRDARRLWLFQQGLAAAPVGPPDLPATVAALGLVQLDSIAVVARAHDHILWSRNRNYRPEMLGRLLAERAVFEHFTHDASVLPIAHGPLWTRQFRRREARMARSAYWQGMTDEAGRRAMLDRIRAEGPLASADFGSGGAPREMWGRAPHKMALDYLWHTGVLSTAGRRNFVKLYDLTERVIPESWRAEERADDDQIAGLCAGALDRMGTATAGEIMRFWGGACDPAEVRAWLARAGAVPVEVEGADGVWRPAVARPDIAARLHALPEPTAGLRILNPFDPAVRDRDRLARLFGFDYRNEIFVPAARRVWGYYVMPLLEGTRFVGRIEAKADRAAGRLALNRLWVEPGVRWTASRQNRLEAELARLARLAGCETVAMPAGL